MKNMKKLLLLGVLLLNLMPYMKDGQLQLETTQQVWAQRYYTIEDTGLGIYICGDYEEPVSVISKIPCESLKEENVDTDEPEFVPCYCAQCGKEKEQCDAPCTSCGTVGTLNADGDDYYTGDSYCRCPTCHQS
jgi:hypothetical protein